MVQVPVPEMTVTSPADESTVQAVEDPAEYVMAPLPALVAVTLWVSRKLFE